MLTPAYLGAAGGESAQQLFISCIALFGRWLGRGSASCRWIPTSLETISSSSLSLQVPHSFLQLIWLLCVWVIWIERNHQVFSNSETPLPQLLEKVKLYSYILVVEGYEHYEGKLIE
jgi:hypothetical protein